MNKLKRFINKYYDIPIISFLRRRFYWTKYRIILEGFIYKTDLGKYSTVRKGAQVYGSQMGYHSGVNMNTFISNTIIGRYSEIAWNCSIGPRNHLYRNFTISDFIYNDEERLKFSGSQTIIGNDVWIGCNTIVLSGVTIGDGAIIGAGSIVTKDVPPFAVVIGAPAKIVKYRFEKNIIEKLMEIKWWLKDKEEIILIKKELEQLVNFNLNV